MRRLSFIVLIVAGVSFVPAKASAITLKEIVELTRAGLSEEVLLALIEIDPRVYPVDPATLRMLKDSGVSERVIVAMVRSGRTPPPEPVPLDFVQPPPPPEPPVVVVERDQPVVQQVVVPVPVFVPVERTRDHHRDQQVHKQPAQPVYWGWGGKRRPDSWKPADEDQQKPGAARPGQRQ